MAAIAKLLTYDGGIAFSDSVIKLQKQDSDAKIIPLEDVTSLSVCRPQGDTDGSIRFQTADGQRHCLYFEEDQLQDAVQFKKQFDALLGKRGGGEPRNTGRAPAPEKPAKKSAGGKGKAPKPAPEEPASKKPILRQWWFWVILAVLLIAVAAAAFFFIRGRDTSPAGGNGAPSVESPAGDNGPPAQETPSPGDEPPATGSPALATEGAGTLGEFEVEIKDAATATDSEGRPAIVITYSWTNNSDQAVSAGTALYAKAFQDGVEMQSTAISDAEGYDPNATAAELDPGASQDVQQAFVMTSESVVEFQIEEFLGTGEMVTKYFDPTSL